MAARVATIFGGSGFVGRYLVQQLARRDWVIRVAVRHPDAALFLRPLGHVGQITPIAANIRDDASVAAAVAHADAVVNLVGILHGQGRQTFQAVHVDGARRVAAAAKAAGARRFVHMSALGADPDSPAEYARSKAAGEEAVRAAFPEAAIARPSVIFGPEDDFFNRFAAMARFLPALPLIGGGATKFQPVYVGDVADALAKMVEDPATQGKTYELGGPQIYSFKELLELLLENIGRKRLLVPLPFSLARLQAAFLELLPAPPLTRDQVAQLKRDNVVSGTKPTLADLGIQPTAVEVILPTYLDRFRRGGRYQTPWRR